VSRQRTFEDQSSLLFFLFLLTFVVLDEEQEETEFLVLVLVLIIDLLFLTKNKKKCFWPCRKQGLRGDATTEGVSLVSSHQIPIIYIFLHAQPNNYNYDCHYSSENSVGSLLHAANLNNN